MEKEEIKKLASSLSENLGSGLEVDIEKFMFSVFENQDLIVGIRNGSELSIGKVVFTSLIMFNDEETVINENYKPEKLFPNEDDYYFASEEISRFNSRDTFFGIIGSKWFDNELGDEFAEAIVFGNHNVSSIDCMLGSVRVKNLFNSPYYLAPGTLVILRKVEFKSTKYLEVESYFSKFVVGDDSGTGWSLGDFQETYYWDGESYSTKSNYSIGNDGYFDDNEDESHEEYDYEEDEYYDDDDMDYNDWLRSEFGDDADTAYWNTH